MHISIKFMISKLITKQTSQKVLLLLASMCSLNQPVGLEYVLVYLLHLQSSNGDDLMAPPLN